MTIAGTENAYARGMQARFGDLRTLEFIGPQTRGRMDALYGRADALVFPSKLETWGLPITETQQHGRAITAADRPYARETVGDYPRAAWVDPADGADRMTPAPSSLPVVRVLLATFNGDRWLDEQLASLSAQVGVAVSVVASDDSSTDRTPAILEAAARDGAFVVLPACATRFGNAHRNFMRLIRDTALTDADYFALADQDDIWLPHKLRRAVDVLRAADADAYGANVTAFWPDGRRKLLVKSQPQRPFDHLFESAGPGCSFVFRRAGFIELQRWVTGNFEALQAIKVHDWLIYAFARERGWRWIIDDASVMLYRQHERNEAGANTGWRGAVPRLRNISQGRFRRDVLAISAVVGARAKVLDRLRRMTPLDRLWLALHARECRRAFKDVVALALLFLLMPRR